MKSMSTSVIDRLRSFINKARLTSAHPNSCPDLIHSMMSPKFKRAIIADAEVHDRLVAEGLSKAIREYLHFTLNGDMGDLTKEQLDLWSEKLRPIVADIERARVYVPSRMEFVPVTPECLSKAEAAEAGDFLVRKGEESIRVGRRLIQLADMM